MCVSYDIENVHKYPWHALKESPWCDGGGAWLCIVREAVYIGVVYRLLIDRYIIQL